MRETKRETQETRDTRRDKRRERHERDKMSHRADVVFISCADWR